VHPSHEDDDTSQDIIRASDAKVGTTVQIIGGSFCCFVGPVTKIDNKTVYVEVVVFGKPTNVGFDLSREAETKISLRPVKKQKRRRN
jgi:transcription antitermination factor NusG